MMLACLLAMATIRDTGPIPRPTATAPIARVVRSGDPDLDAFALRVVENVRTSDWDAFATVAGRKVTFETYEVQNGDPASGSDVLFDDTHAVAGSKVFPYTCKRMSVDTSRAPSSFALDEFSYFASLVDECVSGKTNVAQCQASMLRPDRTSKTPTIWGRVATNATWRIELSHTGGAWRVVRLVIEYH